MADIPQARTGSKTPTSAASEGYDWVTLIAIPTLGIVACLALWFGNETIAGAAVGAVGGLVKRIY
jgi:hypothetical protein